MELNFSTKVKAARPKVFEVFTDFANAASRIDGIESIELLESGPLREGSRFRETRKMFGKATTEEMTVSKLVTDQCYIVTADSCGAHFSTEFRFADDQDGTKVDVSMNSQPYSLFAKIMSPLGKLMAGSMKKMICADIEQLKNHCEKESA